MMYYTEELKYIVDIIAVVLGKERFGKFAEFLDGDPNHEFLEVVTKKDAELRPEEYDLNPCLKPCDEYEDEYK